MNTAKSTAPLRLTARSLSMLVGILILSLVLALLWLSQWLKSSVEPELMVREVSTLALPPPPPPPPRQQQVAQPTSLSLNVQGQGAVMQTINIDPPPLDDFLPPDMPINPVQSTWQSLDVDWQVLDIDALDNLPQLLTPLRVTFPKSLTRRGITQALVKLDVMIDETGQVNLMAVTSNPYPELETELRKLARKSRFTAPQKDNQPTRARFIWPINIKA
ncbi:energy transducer TonB [Paraglaciecola sp. 2405UD69-4]|uniref:energy transducer TonB n=1 Tax=Paraglaciecola sp. 2405UD69-4 TaxID=3391836 RepID=UPI0039C8CD62